MRLEIDGISNNSKNIKKNFIFFAFSGNKTNGNLYIEEAKRNGAINHNIPRDKKTKI